MSFVICVCFWCHLRVWWTKVLLLLQTRMQPEILIRYRSCCIIFEAQIIFGLTLIPTYLAPAVGKLVNSEPPLSPHSAVLIAIGRAPKLVPDAESFVPREVTLKAFGDIWYYIVTLEPRAASPYAYVNAPMTPFPIVVLMDGTIAERTAQHISTLRR